MQQQASLYIQRGRLFLAGILAIFVCIGISALVTAIGSGSMIDTKTVPPTSMIDMSLADGNNAVSGGLYELANGTERTALVVGIGVYGACKSITEQSSAAGLAFIKGMGATLTGTWRGITTTGRIAGNTTGYIARTVTTGSVATMQAPLDVIGTGAKQTEALQSLVQPNQTEHMPSIDPNAATAIVSDVNTKNQQLSAAQKAAAEQELAKHQAEQAAANQRLGGAIVAGDPTHGGYPAQWDAPVYQDSKLDSWGMYNRECVSYAAWKVHQTYGDMPYWGGVGNANQWVSNARRAGIATGSLPAVHSVAISMRGYYGHAMWVEKVEGNMIYVSQYNYDLRGRYSEMWVDGSNFTYIYFK